MNELHFEDISERHLGRAMVRQAQAQGETTFILWGKERHSFAQVNQRVNELAAGLAALGLKRGDHLAFYMSSAPEVIYAVLAACKLGAIWIPINTDYKGAWLEETINRSRPRILLSDGDHIERLLEIRGQISPDWLVLHDCETRPDGTVSLDSLYRGGAQEPDLSGFSYGDDCAVLWTSGTTGKSKGVVQSHNVWFNACYSANLQYGLAQDDVIYSVLPMYNSAAWVTGVFRALIGGVPLALDPAFSVKTFWQRVDYYRATQCFTLGAMHMFLWDAPPEPEDANHCLRRLMAIPMPPAVSQPFSDRFGLELVSQGLGQSEAMRLTAADGVSIPPGSCGLAVPEMTCRLVSEDGQDAAVGEPGELWVRPREAYVIFSGYLDDPAATASAYEGEWYKTGDLLKRDTDGFYYFSDRKKDAVRYKGRNISTFEVELAARRHPAIADCAAFGIPSEEMAAESEIKLNVIVRPGELLEAEELARFINDNAPYFFVPRYIEFVDSLPYTPTNKVQKFKLRERGLTDTTWDGRQAGFKAER